MIYLESFRFPRREDEERYFAGARISRIYNTKYPFHVFRYRELPEFEFEPVTVLCGSNGSGKSTMLNVIAEKLGLRHQTPVNSSPFFADYVNLCREKLHPKCFGTLPGKSRIITSDDVFDQLLETRRINERIDRERDALLEENARIARLRHQGYVYQMSSLDDYDEFEKHVAVSQKHFMDRAAPNIIERSNGENALRLFENMIGDNALYLLDEPENSLSAEKQSEMRDFIANAARFSGCQFIISSHSPFFLSVPHARIYNIDETPPEPCRWTELPGVRAYYELFAENREQFEACDPPRSDQGRYE